MAELPPGNMVLVEGDDEVKRFLAREPRAVDDWLYELVDEFAFFAAQRIREHAPGSIDQLVSVDAAKETDPGAFESVAGVEPDITEETFGVGLGSDPADYPVFVEVGTGIFGPVGQPISTIPGHFMVFEYFGELVFTQTTKGQKPQHYTEDAFEDLTAAAPGMILSKLPELSSRD